MYILSGISKLYDGTAGDASAVHANVDLILDGERIHALEPHRPDRPRRAEDTLVDARGWTVTPGLIDCHGHITLLGVSEAEILRMGQPEGLLLTEKVLYTTLVDGGVTTMRDVGGATDRMKRLVADGVMIGPRLKIAICMLSSTGGHADFRGPDRCHGELSRIWAPGPGRPSSIVDGPWDCRRRVREIVACGADLIKVCTSPGVASPSDRLENQDFSPEEVEAICVEARARGVRVAAHAHSKAGIELAIRSGVHDIQHISFLDERLVEMANERGCTVTPTSWIVQALPDSDGLLPQVLEKAKRVAEVHARAVQFAATGELPILVGTDPVLPGMHGKNYLELAALMREGLSATRAWYGATGLAAREIGAEECGTLQAGQRADLLVATEDVIESPAKLGEGALREVVQDGVGYRGGLEGLPQRDFVSTVRATPGL